MNPWVLYSFIFATGLAVGSFLNVLIYRLPRNKGVVGGRSYCPNCNDKIAFYDNIPLISWVILGGKCRKCKKPISLRYPVVELLNGVAWMFFFSRYSVTPEFYIYSYLFSVLLVIFMVDLDFQIIPDYITISGMILGLGVSFLPGGLTIWQSLTGLLVGGGVLFIVAELGDRIFKKESMGGGDIKMAAMLGAFLGWQKVILIFFSSAFIGMIISIILMAFSKKLRENRVIPFGPFIAIAALLAILYGERIISFYIEHFWLT